MKNIKLWLISILLISAIGGASAYYVWKTLIVPFEVKEPLEVLYFPSQLSLYPGESIEFNVTVMNHASLNYSVILGFSLDNASYQEDYVTSSSEIYTVTPGQQNLTAWLMVQSHAPSVNASLTIDLTRGVYPYGLVGYWKFDERNGTIAFESSTNDNHGLIYGATRVEGKYEKALHLDGVDDYVYIGSSSSLVFSQSVTVACWVKVDSVTGDHQVILAQNYAASNAYTLEFQPDGHTPQFCIHISSGEHRYAVSNVVTQFGEWNYLVGTYDGSVVRIYLNGILRGAGELPGSINVEDKPIQIGAHTATWDRNWFKGTIDNLMIFNRALSSEEVVALYTSPPF